VTIRATVVDVERTGSRLNGRHLWRIRYQYQDPSGRFHKGVSGYMEPIDAQRYRVGEQVYVRYDPAQPSASIWLGREAVASDPKDPGTAVSGVARPNGMAFHSAA